MDPGRLRYTIRSHVQKMTLVSLGLQELLDYGVNHAKLVSELHGMKM